MTKLFQNKIGALENIFYLPNLVKMTRAEYRNTLGHLNTGITYELFHRNVVLALENADKLSDSESRLTKA